MKRWRERRGKGNDRAEDVEEGTRGTAVMVSGRETRTDLLAGQRSAREEEGGAAEAAG